MTKVKRLAIQNWQKKLAS